MNENKICPLLSATKGVCHCWGMSCAWYAPPVLPPSGAVLSEGRCAVQSLAALPDLAKKVGQL